MKIFKRLKIKKGFSLMEILVVLFLVSTTMLGVVSLIIQNIKVQSINKNNLIASSLAQEGIELIRQVRDNNWQNNRPFDFGLWPNQYVADYRNIFPFIVTNQAMTQVYLNDGLYVNNVYSNESGPATIFSRQIVTARLNTYDGNPIQVRSIVSWTDHDRPYRYELQTLLFDWR